jgi:pimeloyl-ACP methyl ester carboxylesterase
LRGLFFVQDAMSLLFSLFVALLHRAPADPALTVMHVVVAPAETLAVTTTGTGTPVVIIPGLLGGAFGFRKVTAQMNALHERVIIVDPLGTGGSSRPRDANYSMQAQAVRVAAALDSIGVRHAVIVGQAAGVPVAFRLALHRPDLVKSILAIGGDTGEKFSAGGLRMAVRLAPIIKLFGGEKKAKTHVVNGLRSASADSSWITTDVVAAYTAPYKQDFSTTLRILKNVMTAPEPWPLTPRLTGVRVPVVLLDPLAGEKRAIKPDELAAMKTAMPQMRVEALPNVGHFVQEERPDLVVAAIRKL